MSAHFAPTARGGADNLGATRPEPEAGQCPAPSTSQGRKELLLRTERRLRRIGALQGAKAAPEGEEVGLGAEVAATPLEAAHGPSRTLGNQGVEVPATICARSNLQSGRLTAQQRPHKSQRLVVRGVHDISPFADRGDPG